MDHATLSELLASNSEYQAYFLEKPGLEHYRLLAYVSKSMPAGSRVADLGTLFGSSALALAANPDVQVITYDVTDHGVTFHLENVTRVIRDAVAAVDEYRTCQLILMDIGLHDGLKEQAILQSLIDAEYDGVLICDDIHLNSGMRRFWENVSLDKEDISDIGHCSGTGIIYFRENTSMRDTIRRARHDLLI